MRNDSERFDCLEKDSPETRGFVSDGWKRLFARIDRSELDVVERLVVSTGAGARPSSLQPGKGYVFALDGRFRLVRANLRERSTASPLEWSRFFESESPNVRFELSPSGSRVLVHAGHPSGEKVFEVTDAGRLDTEGFSAAGRVRFTYAGTSDDVLWCGEDSSYRTLRLWSRGGSPEDSSEFFVAPDGVRALNPWSSGFGEERVTIVTLSTARGLEPWQFDSTARVLRHLQMPAGARILDHAVNGHLYALVETQTASLEPGVYSVRLGGDGTTELEAVSQVPGDIVVQSALVWGKATYFFGSRDLRCVIAVSDEKSSVRRTVELGHGVVEPAGPLGEQAVSFWYSDSTTPPELLAWNREDEKPQVIQRHPALFDAAGLDTRVEHATSLDGTKIPFTIVGSPAALSGEGRVLVQGYGGFGKSLLPWYRPATGRAWLSDGNAYVYAHLRGGREFGPDWETAARGQRKFRAVEDLLAVSERITELGLALPSSLGIWGWSNGGLVVLRSLLEAPEMFGAVCSVAGLADMLGYHELLYGMRWWESEYGWPENEEDRAHLARLSPYHTPLPTALPPILFVTSSDDRTVHPAHSRKMAARLLRAGHENVLYAEYPSGGHTGAVGPGLPDDQALLLTFFRQHLRLSQRE